MTGERRDRTAGQHGGAIFLICFSWGKRGMLGPFRCSVVCGAAVSGSMMQCGVGKVAGEVKIVRLVFQQSEAHLGSVRKSKSGLWCQSLADRGCLYGTLDTSEIYDWLISIVSYDWYSFIVCTLSAGYILSSFTLKKHVVPEADISGKEPVWLCLWTKTIWTMLTKPVKVWRSSESLTMIASSLLLPAWW